MKTGRPHFPRGYTLLEVMLAMAIFSLIMVAIYSTWIGIVKASTTGQSAAIAAQRQRTALHVIEEALSGAQLFVANPNYYSFAPETEGKTSLSFVACLGEDFPRSGKFSGWPMRRVTFSLEAGKDGQKQLLLRQNPILMDMSDDEKIKPVVLARDVKLFKMQFWDDQDHAFKDEWLETNQLPKMVEVTLQVNLAGSHATVTEPKVVALVGLPTTGVLPNWQSPQMGGAPHP